MINKTVNKPAEYKFFQKETRTKKLSETSLKQFETHNPFSVLETYSEEEIDDLFNGLEIVDKQKVLQTKFMLDRLNCSKEEDKDSACGNLINRLEIIEIKKALLKKCRHCNFKKRSCMLDRSSCSAKEKTCLACLKGGHFPRSLNCKRTRKARKSRVQSKTITDQVRKPPKKISSEVHKFINEKIVELETVINSYSNCKRLSKQTSNIPCEVIPFAMMFIFLNYDYIFSVDSYENVRSLLEYEKKSTELRKSILKEANYCARKFSEINFQEDKEHFSTYCSKRLRKTLGIRSISNKMRLL